MKNKILLYTFRTNNLKNEFDSKNLFVFGKLKKDLQIFKEKLIAEEPDFILGFALADKSRIEKFAINNFNNKKIRTDGKNKLESFSPKTNFFKISSNPTKSFCNWTMYQILNYLTEEHLKTRLIFVHFKEEDIDRLNGFIDFLESHKYF